MKGSPEALKAIKYQDLAEDAEVWCEAYLQLGLISCRESKLP
jgi:hypothetical protein